MTVYNVSKVALFSLSIVYCFAAFNKRPNFAKHNFQIYHCDIYQFETAFLLGTDITCVTFYVKEVKRVASRYSNGIY
jgi:hypothetical protein